MVLLAHYFWIKSDGGKHGKLSEHVNVFGIYINRNKDTKLSKYPASKQKEFIGEVDDSEKFITSNKFVTLEEILINKQKSYPIIQAYNNKDKNIILIQFPIKLYDYILKASTNHFIAYYPYYKEIPKIIEFI